MALRSVFCCKINDHCCEIVLQLKTLLDKRDSCWTSNYFLLNIYYLPSMFNRYAKYSAKKIKKLSINNSSGNINIYFLPECVLLRIFSINHKEGNLTSLKKAYVRDPEEHLTRSTGVQFSFAAGHRVVKKWQKMSAINSWTGGQRYVSHPWY